MRHAFLYMAPDVMPGLPALHQNWMRKAKTPRVQVLHPGDYRIPTTSGYGNLDIPTKWPHLCNLPSLRAL